MYPIHTSYLFAHLFHGQQTPYSNFNLACDLPILPRHGLMAPVPERDLRDSVKPSRLQDGLPTELLQAIFLELDTVDDARAAIATCHTMHNAFEDYKKKIIWNILCREVESAFSGTCEVEFMLPGTFGGLAIFVSRRRGTEGRLLAPDMSVSTRPRARMEGEHGDLAWGLVTLGMAADMVVCYRRFVKTMAFSPRMQWSACVTTMLADEDWGPMWRYTRCKCAEHMHSESAVRFRLRCHMVVDYKPPGETPGETPRASVSRVLFRCGEMISEMKSR